MTNAWIIEGHLGVKADNPDYAAMNVIGEILGGGFSSRLFNEIRTKRGLAYMAGSVSGTDIARPGTLLRIRGDTGRLGSRRPAADAEGDPEDHRGAGDRSGAEPRERRDPELLRIQVRVEGTDRGADEPTSTSSDTRPTSRRAIPRWFANSRRRICWPPAKRQIHPDDLQILIVGNEKDFATPLSEPRAAHRASRSHDSGTGVGERDSRRDARRASPRESGFSTRRPPRRAGRVGVDPRTSRRTWRC